ncbi:MAG: pantoate--beta-alanine ligase [Chryseotalea sp.]|jgi:pantoate--beta-alanine ligase|nr:pantoate--beta-alanine ligase [Flammeovirgaceae bacterium]
MEIFREIKSLKAFLRKKKLAQIQIGFVPTMGALHEGHLSLIEASRKHGLFTVCSIFVNPAQFNNASDLANYPRTETTDIDLLTRAGCDVLFSPSAQEIYPQKAGLRFTFPGLDTVMEGAFRPGHFSGVGLVVSKLFNIVEPDHAFFGQKDWQQFTIIRQLVHDLNFNLTLHAVPTMREENGLAMSSRNQRLSAEEKIKALVLYQTLKLAEAELLNGKTMHEIFPKLKALAENDSSVKIEYLTLANRHTLESVNTLTQKNQLVLCIAGFVGEVRLIDNILI